MWKSILLQSRFHQAATQEIEGLSTHFVTMRLKPLIQKQALKIAPEVHDFFKKSRCQWSSVIFMMIRTYKGNQFCCDEIPQTLNIKIHCSP